MSELQTNDDGMLGIKVWTVVNRISTVIIADLLWIWVKQQLAGPKIEILTLNMSDDPSLLIPDRVTSYYLNLQKD